MGQDFFHRLCEINSDAGQVLAGEPMSKHTTFRIGGPAKYFCLPKTKEQLSATIAACQEAGEDYYILGNGSNILVSDEGYQGVVIQLFQNMNELRCDNCRLYAQAGVLLVKAAHQAGQNSLTGMEFASGIPGTIGGALVMNAGAYGGEMKDIVQEVTVLTREGKIIKLSRDELEMGYRTSVIAKKQYIVLDTVIQLSKGDPKEIEAGMQELKEARTSKQPLEYPSAGSTFKRPQGYFAGKLIMDAGLRGFQIGGAQVSEKHCGFVINTGGATAQDVLTLITHVQTEVERQFGVTLEMEIKTLGL